MTIHEDIGYTRRSDTPKSSGPKRLPSYAHGDVLEIELHKGLRPAWLPEGIYSKLEEDTLLTLASHPLYWYHIRENTFLLELLKDYLAARTAAFKEYIGAKFDSGQTKSVEKDQHSSV
jgi:hypothetical protein